MKSSTSRPGGVKLKDLNGDGAITPKDRQIIGNANPDFVFGISNDFSYKNFDLHFLLQGTSGNDIMNLLKVSLSEAPSKTSSHGSTLRAVQGYWIGEGTSNKQQAINESLGTISSPYVEDRSYIRLKNLSFGYTLPKRLINRIGISNCRVYVSGQNLFTITGYSRYDLEVSSRETGKNTNITLGYDAGSYPATGSFTFGLNVTF